MKLSRKELRAMWSPELQKRVGRLTDRELKEFVAKVSKHARELRRYFRQVEHFSSAPQNKPKPEAGR